MEQRINRGRKAVYPRDGDGDEVDTEVGRVEEMEAPVSDEVSIDARSKFKEEATSTKQGRGCLLCTSGNYLLCDGAVATGQVTDTEWDGRIMDIDHALLRPLTAGDDQVQRERDDGILCTVALNCARFRVYQLAANSRLILKHATPGVSNFGEVFQITPPPSHHSLPRSPF